jgi:Zn-dependent alcohol dehydrogenase
MKVLTMSSQMKLHKMEAIKLKLEDNLIHTVAFGRDRISDMLETYIACAKQNNITIEELLSLLKELDIINNELD